MKIDNLDLTSIFYHDIFDYPLDTFDLIHWRVGEKATFKGLAFKVVEENGYIFKEGRKGLIFKRRLREKNFNRKLAIAKRGAKLMSFVPSVLAVGLTGSLAMKNAGDESDIDLLIVTAQKTLWTTRLLAIFLLKVFGIQTRRFGDREEKDKLCLNLWLDESALAWPEPDRNIYTAHEICQIIPLLNKANTFDKFLQKNVWVRGYWPNAARREYKGESIKYKGKTNFLVPIFESLARSFQLWHMRKKITREKVSSNRAVFHPQDWSKIVKDRFSS